MPKNTNANGFTIVELLIVIVVIAILAAIGIVAYGGIQNRTYDVSVQSDLKAIMTKVELMKVDSSAGTYPMSGGQLPVSLVKLNKSAYAISPTTSYNIMTCYTAEGSSFGAVALSKSGNIFYVANGGQVKSYPSAWAGTSMCDVILGETSSSNYGGYNSADTTTGPWRAWAGGN